ncbi:hypothetical protein JG687_00009069, partial [Phytophthora cactorum]
LVDRSPSDLRRVSIEPHYPNVTLNEALRVRVWISHSFHVEPLLRGWRRVLLDRVDWSVHMFLRATGRVWCPGVRVLWTYRRVPTS